MARERFVVDRNGTRFPFLEMAACHKPDPKRCEEALRVLEEYGRVMSPGATKRAQAIRFKVYEWETKLLSNGLTKHGSTS